MYSYGLPSLQYWLAAPVRPPPAPAPPAPARPPPPQPPQPQQLRALLAAYRVGMLALEAQARRVHDDRPQNKYSRYTRSVFIFHLIDVNPGGDLLYFEFLHVTRHTRHVFTSVG